MLVKFMAQSKHHSKSQIDNLERRATPSVWFYSLIPRVKHAYDITRNSRHGWFFVGVFALLAYIFAFQTSFLLSGDTWAEAFPEYVNEAVTKGWLEVFKSSWAGYLTLAPSFISKLYVYLGLPIGYIDIYMRLVVVLFAVACVGFISHPVNRKIIPNDFIRLVVMFLVFFSLRHISVLAFINVWYLGFIVIALVSLSGKKFARKYEWLYTIGSLIVILSKSSLVVLPFIIYRGVMTKRYAQSVLLSSAVLLQTFLTVFAPTGYGSKSVTTSLVDVLIGMPVGASILFMKFLHFPYVNHLSIVFFIVLLASISVYLYKRKGLWIILTLAAGLFISLYLQLFAPDNPFKHFWSDYVGLYNDTSKLQREIFTMFLFSLMVGTALSEAYIHGRVLPLRGRKIAGAVIGVIIVTLLLAANPLTQVLSTDPSLHTDIEPFRAPLNRGESLCMPVAPTPLLDPQGNWFFQYKGGCYQKQTHNPIDLGSFTSSLKTTDLIITSPYKQGELIETILLPIKKQPHTNGELTMTELNSGTKRTVKLKNDSESYAFVSFEIPEIKTGSSGYKFRVQQQNGDSIYAGVSEGGNPLVYIYYMGY